jgi:hypothetical protein
MYKDRPRDVNPSKYLAAVAHIAVAVEVGLGPLSLLWPAVGVPIATLFHLYILSMTPFASVMEWNVCCLYLIQALFVADGFAGYTPASLLTAVGATPPVFLAWLLFVLLAVPLYGQLFPKEVPFLVAFRPYAGNWRFTWHIVSKSGKEKLRKLKTLEGVFVGENAKVLWGGNPHFCAQFEDYFSGNMIFFPHFRPLIPMVEKLMQRQNWGIDDFSTLFNEVFLNAVTGWTLGTGFYVNGAYFDAVSSTCGFEPGECFVAVFEPMGLHDHTCEWHCVDITDPGTKIMHGTLPYAELEDMQPGEMSLELFEKNTTFRNGPQKQD